MILILFLLYNLLTNNFEQCKTYETNCKLPLTEKKEKLIYFTY